MSELSGPVNQELIDRICAQLDRNEHITCAVGEQGQLLIDRQLPYLCVHRRIDEQTDTESLLHGQAAYLTVEPHSGIAELVRAIAEHQSNLFGCFLIFELWAGAGQNHAAKDAPVPVFHVHAPEKGVSNKVLDSFENSLQSIRLRNAPSAVSVSFGALPSPPGMSPLLASDEAEHLKCVVLGLEMAPAYRDEDGNTLPFALRIMQRDLTRAIKELLYQFSHQQTLYRPSHYHELGPRAITEQVRNVDQQLAQLSEKFDLLLHVTPINTVQVWTEFERNGFSNISEFRYRPRNVDPALLKRALYQVRLEEIGDPTLADVFNAKREELDRQLTLLNDRNSDAFLHGSIQLFGQVDSTLLGAAKSLIWQRSSAPSFDDETLDAEGLARYAREELEYYRKTDPSLTAIVEVRDDITGILVSAGNFLIGSDARVSKRRLDATLNHEIGTHAVTYHNGKNQPLHLLYAGMAGYEELQEGLAVLGEYLGGGLNLPRLQLLAGRVIAVHCICNGAGFLECFDTLCKDYGFREFTAFNMTMRVYRGGGYTKDLIYLRGFLKVLDYIARQGDLELLLCGKLAMDHVNLLEDLRWRGVLKPLAITPRYLQPEFVGKRLEELQADPSINHITGRM